MNDEGRKSLRGMEGRGKWGGEWDEGGRRWGYGE
jgi:hypothetical protein